VCRDSDDDRVIECAVAACAEYIVTEDKDLLSLGSYDGIKILRTVDFTSRAGLTDIRK
jgi:predicted nucleic acid-binding protein